LFFALEAQFLIAEHKDFTSRSDVLRVESSDACRGGWHHQPGNNVKPDARRRQLARMNAR
jgi:hypothetical protein